ncbi:MAG: hypothetical protein HN377_00180 [Alphaproteobacteria bacterium]|jgi:hypothetical protein|nr:hypothetical protein [Alphaproteobacteria bacterium]
MGKELFNEDGDATLHAEILDNPEADAALAEIAIKEAIADGVSREDAVSMYGVKD